ncbi:very short patch repair endonuclease [Sphingobium sp. TomTYG45]
MRWIKSKDTSPELAVRRILHRLGYRYRLHRRDLPGKPDLVFGTRRKVIFVHGCFWHQHQGCSAGRNPASNTGYWTPKLRRNVERDLHNRSALQADGWEIMVIWACETSSRDALERRMRDFLGPPGTISK